MADQVMRYLRRLNQQGRRLAPQIGHHHQLLLDSGRIFMVLGALVLIHQVTTSAAASSHAEDHVFIAFLIWLLGTALAMLSLVAQRFPRLAFHTATVARALRSYLLGGL